MDAVTEDRFLTEDAPLHQPVNGQHMVVITAVLYVVEPLADVDMVTRPAVIRLDAFFKGTVGDREQRVHAEHGTEHRIILLLAILDKVGILLDGFITLRLAVTVGDLVA